jgi:hypothetical protein
MALQCANFDIFNATIPNFSILKSIITSLEMLQKRYIAISGLSYYEKNVLHIFELCLITIIITQYIRAYLFFKSVQLFLIREMTFPAFQALFSKIIKMLSR